ncbi:CSF2R factor, partial [Thryothorus ludovicianus]|nr:CSF2R factor [Thryothorus ludovicianus]
LLADTGYVSLSHWCLAKSQSLFKHCQLIKQEDAQESPITNVNVDWRKMELSWESSRNFSEYTCTIMDRDVEYRDIEVGCSVCNIPVELHMPLHKGVSFVIEVPNTNVSKQCTFLPGGMNGSAIENFSCVIYNILLMNCTWQAGRDAPADTQYFLYWQKSR